MNHEFWYLSRAAGFTAYLLLFASSVLGIAMSTKLAARFKRGNVSFDIHRFLVILAVAFSIFHIYILLGDAYFNFSVWQLSVPFMLPYRTLSTAMGAISMYALILITISFYVKKYIGYRTWRSLHYLTFAMYVGVTLHGIFSGTDTSAAWARLIYAGTGICLLLMVMYRISERRLTTEGAVVMQRAAIALAAGAALVVALATGMMLAGGVEAFAG